MFSIEYIRALNNAKAKEYIKERRDSKRKPKESKPELHSFIGRLMPISG